MTKTETMSAAEFKAKHGGKPQRSKYNNVPTEVDGIVFDSGREASRYVELREAEAKGQIRNLKLQYVFPIVIDGVRICDYIADAVYEELRNGQWKRVVARMRRARQLRSSGSRRSS